MATKIVLENGDLLVQQIKGIGAKGQTAYRSALLAGSKIIAAEVRRRAPRSDPVRASTPKTSRKGKRGGTSQSWRSTEHMADVVAPTVVKGNVVHFGGVTTPGGVVNGQHFYIRLLEYGTVHITARKFVSASVEATMGEVESAFETTLRSKLGL